MIYPCLYNAPLVYYALILHEHKPFVVEHYDHYTKQTFRNRCSILGGNGTMDIVVPVVKNHGKKTLMKDVLIDYDSSWQAVHWKSIHSAYASSPFFEYVADYYEPYYSKRYKYLADLNCDLLFTTLELLNFDLTFTKSDDFTPLDSMDDLRDTIHPKKAFKVGSMVYTPFPYQQVFSDRHGFKDNLSILDLLFNEGQNAAMILKNSVSSSEQ